MKVSYHNGVRAVLTAMLAISALLTAGQAAQASSPSAAPISQLDFHNAMRKLWEDHITWTRLYIVSAVAGLPDKDATTQRLLSNQDDIGNAIKPFYGDAAGNKLTALLREHILGAAALLDAAKSGDSAAVQSASDKWYANANDIATFLSSANPNAWPLDQMKSAMKMHLDLTLNEAVDHLKGNFAADVADYDKVHEEILGMADALSAGIIAQFPSKFSAPPPEAETSFRSSMRKLWEDHITWTRLYIVSAVAGLPDKDATTQRLLSNQDDIGNAIKPFYGDAAGNQLTSLLREHILGAATLLDAAKSGDSAAVQSASDKWYANANDIAAFLHNANPNAWPLDQMQMGMKMHLDLTLNEAVDHLKGNFAADVVDYDKVHEEILGMADALSGGIIAQFPDRFVGSGPRPTGMPRTGAEAAIDLGALVWQLAIAGLLFIATGWLARRHDSSSKKR